MKTILDIDHVNAFCRHTHVELPSHHAGPLAGLRFGAKDIFDIADYPTGFGSPDWFNTHPRATQTAPAIEMLIHSGASLVGKTHTDELTYSLLGMNAHYGTPINSAAPLRIPGGSSSGSAAAVVANLVDFAIGSDTGGSVRAPASFCGIYGMRPTHGRISLAHTRPLAKSFDTVGWFTREPKLLLQVGEVLLREKAESQAHSPAPFEPFFLEEAWDLIDPQLAQYVKAQLLKIPFLSSCQSLSIHPYVLADWANTFRIIQGAEIWAEHGTWAAKHIEQMGPGVKERFMAASNISPSELKTALQQQVVIKKCLETILSHQRVVIIPTAANLPPLLNSSPAEFDRFRGDSFRLLCIAGLAGLPQINLPLIKIDGVPFGVSIIGAAHTDIELLQLACSL